MIKFEKNIMAARAHHPDAARAALRENILGQAKMLALAPLDRKVPPLYEALIQQMHLLFPLQVESYLE